MGTRALEDIRWFLGNYNNDRADNDRKRRVGETLEALIGRMVIPPLTETFRYVDQHQVKWCFAKSDAVNEVAGIRAE